MWLTRTDILCDKITDDLKFKFYQMAIWPVVLYGAESWLVMKMNLSLVSCGDKNAVLDQWYHVF